MNLVNHIIPAIKFNGNFCVIGIDGPTASGKTTFAKKLVERLTEKNIHSVTYHLDWTLTERSERLKQVEKILKDENYNFEYEDFFHMELERAKTFLEDIEVLRLKKFDSKQISVNELYNREDNGLCNGVQNLVLKKNTVVIVEGHYTHHQLLRSYFDINYMLITHTDELLRRKKERVGAYRDEEITTQYFYQIDLPSFRHYYKQNKPFIHNIFTNESFENQEKLNVETLENLLNVNLISDLKPSSLLVPVVNKAYKKERKQMDLFLDELPFLHRKLISIWGIHPRYRKQGIIETIKSFLYAQKAQMYYVSTDIENKDFLYYEFGFVILNMHCVVACSQSCINLFVVSDFTQRLLILKFDKDGSASDKGFELTPIHSLNINKQVVVVPNKFLIPENLKDEKQYEYFLYKEENNLINVLQTIISNKSFLICRINDNSKCNYYETLFIKLGFCFFKSFNYLFATNWIDKKALDIFFELRKKYGLINNENGYEINETKIETALQKLGIRHIDNCYIFPDSINVERFLAFYKNAKPSIKNRLYRSFWAQFPDVLLKPKVSFSDYIQNLPVSLKELYFALSLSQNGAIPFLSVYTTKYNTIDIETYFNYFSEMRKPFGIQASMNALGTKGKENNGYLHIDGPLAFSKKIKTQLFKYIERNRGKQLPPWGFGIDHAAVSLQNSTQLVKFIEEAIQSDWFTSFCIDVSALITYEADDISMTKTSYSLEQIKDKFSFINGDVEFYMGNENIFIKLNDNRALALYEKFSKLFDFIFSKKNNCDFYLFGPFLGTLHHRMHKGLKQKLSKLIFKKILGNRFIGNVLHGTSLTSFSEIKEFAKNYCIRVNFAGKFLSGFIEALPPDIKNQMGHNQEEQKHKLALLNKDVLNINKKAIRKNLVEILEGLHKETSVEKMEGDEIRWFRQNHVCIPDTDFALILKRIKEKTSKTKIEIHKASVIYLASMIEVPFELFKNALVKRLVDAGINHFHIDFGDGELISRKLDGLERLQYLSAAYPKVHTHLHLMVKKPFEKTDGSSLIKHIGKTKKSLIYIHAETYNALPDWGTGIKEIKQNACVPGLVIKLEEGKNLIQLLQSAKRNHIHNILMMGVPLGRGGQSFNTNVIKHIEKAKKWAAQNKYELFVEVDGGLSDNNINECIEAGSDFLSGWSLFLKFGVDGLEKRIKELLHE